MYFNNFNKISKFWKIINIILKLNLIKKYKINKKIWKIILINLLVFTENKKGYLIPCILTTRIVPNLDNGIQAIGFLRLADNSINENLN